MTPSNKPIIRYANILTKLTHKFFKSEKNTVLSILPKCSDILSNATDVKCAVTYSKTVVEGIDLRSLSDQDLKLTNIAYTLIQNATKLVQNNQEIADNLKNDTTFKTDLNDASTSTDDIVEKVCKFSFLCLKIS